MFNRIITDLRREWYLGCPAGQGCGSVGDAVSGAIYSLCGHLAEHVRAVRPFASTDQLDTSLIAIAADLRAYATLPVEQRASAIMAILTRMQEIGREFLRDITVEEQAEPEPVIFAPAVPPTTLIEALHRLSPAAFEHLIARLLKAKGFVDAQLVGGANDRGVDIVCRDSDGSLIAVQCKRYAPNDASRRVGAPVVQLLSAMALQRRAHRGILVTTAAFTASAYQQARDFDIELIDGENLVRMIEEYPHLLETVRAG